ncbi:MAG TPA: GNAT family protein [Chitinophagaceae bacterium]|nr:GNAT family protein [Chitinophagaceae bacterium]
MLRFIPIDVDEKANEQFAGHPECEQILAIFTDHYKKVGYELPWIAYFFSDDQGELIGGGGFKGAPINGKIEISYGTFEKHQRRGVATQICRELINLALETDPSVIITARTLPDNLASIRVLEKNSFVNRGLIYDEEDGDVFEFVFKRDAETDTETQK